MQLLQTYHPDYQTLVAYYIAFVAPGLLLIMLELAHELLPVKKWLIIYYDSISDLPRPFFLIQAPLAKNSRVRGGKNLPK